jgi:hypothetical protein
MMRTPLSCNAQWIGCGILSAISDILAKSWQEVAGVASELDELYHPLSMRFFANGRGLLQAGSRMRQLSAGTLDGDRTGVEGLAAV